ncbi:MAG TPA: aminotransferase class III-fold pyridoxal phosphate-dependent enzyme [Myxococcota bacterium]|nr:aminotransferase class III-fold pyridoxal phosphate-dependent enzyme [Myxococcota bacterium]
MGSRLDEIAAREARHFLPVVRRLPVALVEGRGSRVRDVEGREYVDLTAGWGVCAIGHCHPRLVEAIARQAGRLMQTTNLFYTLPQLDLAERVIGFSPPALTRAFFTSSGTEAMEGALKLAHRATERTQFVSTTNSFHGRSLGALSVIGQDKHRAPYARILHEGCFVPFGDLDAARRAVGANTAAFVVEPVQGEGGVNVAPPGYLAGLREITSRAGALLVLDEIQTGIGRTGRWLALEHDAKPAGSLNWCPDVVTLGKGLGGGFPIAAFLCTEDVAKTVSLGDHGGTYAGNPLACAASDAVLREIDEQGLVARADTIGRRVLERLEQFAKQHPERAARARGRGLLLGLEVRDAEAAATLSRRAIERGVLVNVTAGTVLRLFPALNIPEEDLWPALETVLELVISG